MSKTFQKCCQPESFDKKLIFTSVNRCMKVSFFKTGKFKFVCGKTRGRKGSCSHLVTRGRIHSYSHLVTRHRNHFYSLLVTRHGKNWCSRLVTRRRKNSCSCLVTSRRNGSCLRLLTGRRNVFCFLFSNYILVWTMHLKTKFKLLKP